MAFEARSTEVLKHFRSTAFLPSPSAQVHDLSLRRFTGDDAHEMRPPTLQRAAPFLQVQRLVVSAGDAGLVPADMAKHHLDDMWRDMETIMQASRERAPEIVRPPIKHLAMARLSNTRVELSLALRPALEAASSAIAEGMIPRRAIRGDPSGKCF